MNSIVPTDHVTVVGLVPQPLSECEAEVDLVMIQTFFCLRMDIMLKKYQLAKEQQDLHKKAGGVVSKQGQLQPRFDLKL